MTRPLRVLVLSTPVGAIGSGTGGGVEVTLRGIATSLVARGHHVEVVAPVGSSSIGVPLHVVDGTPQPSMQFVERSTVVGAPDGSVLDNMWRFVCDRHHDFDVVLNLAYDELPFRCANELRRPVAHLVSMGSLTDAMDDAIASVLATTPGAVAMHSRAQAATFPDASGATILGGGIDTSSCRFVDVPHPDGRIAFVGRVSPEKGLRDVVAASARARRPLHVWGHLQDEAEFAAACEQAAGARVTYRGFVEPEKMRAELGECAALVMAPKWIEAFGNVAIEALACGVPVVAYRRGGPTEIVVDGETGYLVEPDSVEALAAGITAVGSLSRAACRRSADEHHSVGAFAARVEAWLDGLVRSGGRADFSGTPLSF